MGQHGRSNQKACSFHDLCGFAGVPQEQRVERPTVAELLEFEMFVLELFRVFGPLNRAARICRGRAGIETNSNRPRKGNVGGARRPVSRVLSASCDAGRSFLWDTHRCVPRATNPGGEAKNLWPIRQRALTDRAGRPYSVLLPVGFALPPPLPEARCALAAPFHPCPQASSRLPGTACGRFVFCGTFPGVAPAGR